MYLIIFVSLVVIILTAIVTTVETAFFIVSKGEIEVAVQKNVIGAAQLKELKQYPAKTIVTLVILNNIVVTIGSIFIGFLTASILGDGFLGIISAALAILMIVLSEIIPKTIGELYAAPIARYAAKPLIITTYILFPFVWILEHITKIFGRDDKHVSEDELKALSKLGSSQGSIMAGEHQIIHNAFTLNDLTAADIMTPRTVIGYLDQNKTLNEERDVICDAPYSRYPVVGKDIDDIVGMCQTKHLLIAFSCGQGDKKVSELMTKHLQVREDIKLDALMGIFQKTRMHLAVVQDEFGGTAGVVTLEDVIEQLVGEIVDETDEYADLRQYAQHKQK